MENTNESAPWIPTSFSTDPDTPEGDSLSSFQSAATPGSAVVDQQSDDQSFDAISRQKLNLTIATSSSHDRTSPKSPRVPGMSMFEEDTRSSWSVEPKPTQLKESTLDDDSRNSVDSQKSSVKTPSSCGVEPAPPDKELQLKEEAPDDESESSLASNQKSPVKTPSTWTAEPNVEESKENSQDVELNNEPVKQQLFEETASVWNVEANNTDIKQEIAMDEDSRISGGCPETLQEDPNAKEDSNLWDVNKPEEVKEMAIDEDSQISTDCPKSPKKNQDSPKRAVSPVVISSKPVEAAVLEEESRSSVISQKSQSSQKSSKRQRCSDDEGAANVFSAENLFEYMWPQENGEFFILQEQICDYLNIKSFKRKYPDLSRRTVEMDEKQFLKEKGIVTEMQCDLGLTALRSEEVLELMSKDYPDHYKDYIKVLREKEQQSITEKHKEFVASNSDKTKMVDMVKKAMQSAAEYNAHLNQERREERRSCMDLQTYTIHYPVKKSQKPKQNTKPGKYPVALLPGQYQDYYKEYTPNELKYLPVNTVLYGPLKELPTTKALSDGSQSDSEDSSGSEGSCSSSQGTHDDSSSGSEKNEKGENGRVSSSTSERNGTTSEVNYRPKVKPNAICKVCKKGPESKDGRTDELVHCSECENSAHPSCIELTMDVVNVLKTYPWQCMDCKVCSHCRDPNDEDKMLFCDFCDRGYHTFCVGLKNLPQGKWVCRRCGSCSICGATKPGPETSKAQWLYDSSKGVVELDANHKPKIMCQSCFRKKR